MTFGQLNKNLYMLKGEFAKSGYDWWWHSFTARNEKTGEEKPFYIEYFIINPDVSPNKFVLGSDGKPSYFMINCGTWCKNKAQLHRYYNVSDIIICQSELRIMGPDFLLTEDRIKGYVDVKNAHPKELTDNGQMEWDIKLE